MTQQHPTKGEHNEAQGFVYSDQNERAEYRRQMSEILTVSENPTVSVRASTASPSDAPRNGLVFTPSLGPVGGMTLYRDGRMVAGWALSLRRTFL